MQAEVVWSLKDVMQVITAQQLGAGQFPEIPLTKHFKNPTFQK
jgi:hypothetical protein